MAIPSGFGRPLRNTVGQESRERYRVRSAFGWTKLVSLDDTSIGKRITHPKFHPFLDLPVEIRLEIYDVVATTPEYGDYVYQELTKPIVDWALREQEMDTLQSQQKSYHLECKAVTKTRNSLRQVSRQIGAEFAPTFYQNVKVIVHAQQAPSRNPFFDPSSLNATRLDGYTNASVKSIITRGTAVDFGTKFLRNISPQGLSNIRYLSYDASITRWGEIRIPAKFALLPGERQVRIPGSSNIDFDGLMQFPAILNAYKNSLPSLEEVELIGISDLSLNIYRVTRGTGHMPDQIWSKAIENGRWEMVVEVMVGSRDQTAQSTAPLAGWEVSRQVCVDGGLHGVYIRQVRITFWKPENMFQQHGGEVENQPHSSTPANLDPAPEVEYHPAGSGLDLYGNTVPSPLA